MGYQSKYTGEQIEECLDLIHGVDDAIKESQEDTLQQVDSLIDQKLQDIIALLSDPWKEL